MSDQELVKGLLAVPANNKLHEYFINVKCRNLLKCISVDLYNDNNSDAIVGEFYEYISKDDWKLLRNWEGKNNCTLYSYLSECSRRYFHAQRIADKKREDIETRDFIPELIEHINHISMDDEYNLPPVWEAYNMLNERDRAIIRLLVIEEKEMMSAAPEIWKYINSSRHYNELSQKQIQSTISMIKHRALLTLLDYTNKLKEMHEKHDACDSE